MAGARYGKIVPEPGIPHRRLVVQCDRYGEKIISVLGRHVSTHIEERPTGLDSGMHAVHEFFPRGIIPLSTYHVYARFSPERKTHDAETKRILAALKARSRR